MSGRTRLTLGSIVLAIAATALPAAAGTVHWHVEATPALPGRAVQLLAVSCPSPSRCFAVGSSYPFASGDVRRLVERWNGASWSIVDTEAPAAFTSTELMAIACSSPRACTAVGDGDTSAGGPKPFIERWDGHRWSYQPSPLPHGTTQAMLWGVACPAATSCIAIGNPAGGSGYAEHWNGRAWSLQSLPTPNGDYFLDAVSCVSTTNCTVVGSVLNGEIFLEHAVILHWNGTKWSRQMPAVPADPNRSAELWTVDCATSSSCFAAGMSYLGDSTIYDERRLVEHWNGSSWSIVFTPLPSDRVSGGFFHGVACRRGGTCVLAGDYMGSGSTRQTLAEHWNGHAFVVDATIKPKESQFLAAACDLSVSCVAVGHHGNAPLVEREP